MIEVLIIEDDRRVAEINRRFLEKMKGFKLIAIACSGEEAKEYLEVMKPQLVLLDVYLPDISGSDLVWYIRKTYKDIDIIMMTATGETETVQEALRGGVFDYLVKPITLDRFRQSLDKYKERIQFIHSMKVMGQDEVDYLIHRGVREEIGGIHTMSLPKGIDPTTLEKVERVVLGNGDSGLTAEQVGRKLGASRTTARRYLEYLVSTERLRADLAYGTIGRPERRYGMKADNM
ncbi:two-component system, CitB family, response regulator [Thermoactinomyces sp. DSM 45891]|uniref:response regulator n=1 Tax=Thermoactinomyces sp. DSM 45891 TaxID=1761907 RepID=UPI00090F084F|nr:response regulator [Thermoactinomyces sp. DSM 45891]SFX41968.1 two-component system, CitB family, response regulator [Thermoactinomyces sp. DSM 45891]